MLKFVILQDTDWNGYRKTGETVTSEDRLDVIYPALFSIHPDSQAEAERLAAEKAEAERLAALKKAKH